MAREHFLCSAVGTDLAGKRRKFTVYKLRGRGFKIYNDKGHRHISHGSLTATECDIKREIITVYDVDNVIVEGSVLQGVLSSTWPLSCQHCANCGCEPTRRRYGGRVEGRGYCVVCLGVIERKEAAKNWDRDRPDTWNRIYLDKSTILNSYSAKQFKIYRNEFIRQAELRLSQLRDTEGKRQGSIPVYGRDIENIRARLLKQIRRKARLLCDEGYVEEKFSAEQRRILYILLTDLEENIPWRFPWWEGMEAVYRHLVEMTNHPR